HAARSIRARKHATVDGIPLAFDPGVDLVWDPLAGGLEHPNAIDFAILDAAGAVLTQERYLSVGGGFVERIEPDGSRTPVGVRAGTRHPPRHRFGDGVGLMRICKRLRVGWSWVALENEQATTGKTEAAVRDGLLAVWSAMRDCIRRGIEADPKERLPGRLNVYRRAPTAHRAARDGTAARLPLSDPVELLAHAYALAVNEENACGGRVVTAPTNGAAGVIPAAFAALQDAGRVDAGEIVRGLLTAGLIGALIKRAASLSGAEMGCQGEVGSACAMAAGGIVEMLGGTPDQVEMAAEIGIEHHLGMTCDPVGGLVQIPCIERNVMGAVKALHAATLALGSSGKHRISLDESIAAMRQIGLDMNAKYKETARGGLAAVSSAPHHVEC
ncbi:MAG: L-serine ammonia-lyase, partial [Verrucomicrobia bacterium]|nr:L-serine ammonia-lyase [Verrucomicrobiota bacterium]